MKRRNRTGYGGVGLGYEPPIGTAQFQALETENDATELSWGNGLVPPDLENTPPSEGGRYKGVSPPQPPTVQISRGQ